MIRDMNRDQLIQAAIKDIDRGYLIGPYGHSDPATNYLAAIAKLLLVQARDAAASRGPLNLHCTRCWHTLSECNCGPPLQHCTRCGHILPECNCGQLPQLPSEGL